MTPSADFLARMAAGSRQRVAASSTSLPAAQLRRIARQAPPPTQLRLNTFDVIAELKKRSPAQGVLQDAQFDAIGQVVAYARNGACAVSVLTEPDAFNGSLDDLAAAATALRELACPVMRKDFLTDPYQVIEARAAGASGVLIIITMLDDMEIEALLDTARDMGLFVLLEGFDTADLQRISQFDLDGFNQPVLAGLNCRDLKSLQVDFERFAALADSLPAALPCVAESGVGSAEDIERLAHLGYRLALVGSSLMTAAGPGGTLRDFIARGRQALGAG